MKRGKKFTRPCDSKKRFKTIRIAHDALNKIREFSDRDYAPTRAYKCDDCGFYHLTKVKGYYGE